MRDLISRQEAIDAIWSHATALLESYDYDIFIQSIYKMANRHVVDVIKQLPSAQSEIIRCKDCKYGSPNGKYGCKCYHYRLYETHDMKPEDFCSRAERRTDE